MEIKIAWRVNGGIVEIGSYYSDGKTNVNYHIGTKKSKEKKVCLKNGLKLLPVKKGAKGWQYFEKMRQRAKEAGLLDENEIVRGEIWATGTSEAGRFYNGGETRGSKTQTLRYWSNSRQDWVEREDAEEEYGLSLVERGDKKNNVVNLGKKAQSDNEENSENEELFENPEKPNFSLNQILYGPPGTGKTYNSVVYAVAICDAEEYGNDPVENLKNRLKNNEITYDKVLKRYNELKEQGRIDFVTFHQSYGYEEFIQGIKPSVNAGGQVVYNIENGIFKEFCQNEDVVVDDTNQDSAFDDAWNKLIDDVLGQGGKLEIHLKTKDRRLEWRSEKFYVADHTHQTQFVDYKTVKSVYKKTFIKKDSSGTNGVKYTTSEGIIDVLKKEYDLQEYKESIDSLPSCPVGHKVLPKVFIIDEINRGNVSKIFGELITLIEESKRISAKGEGMKVKLPYNGEEFGVPDNVYILGTMNTADRSLVQLDAALRRRFRFIEMMPEPKLLGGHKVLDKDGNDTNVDLENLLSAINERICALVDREHQIGHSYFMKVESLKDLRETFQYEIIPLLQEYFYEDYENINRVLNGNGFIEKKTKWDYVKEAETFVLNKEAIEKAEVNNFKKIYEFQDGK